jgi:hypothetical protein
MNRIARFIDEKLVTAGAALVLLLLVLVVNGSLILSQYAPPTGPDAPEEPGGAGTERRYRRGGRTIGAASFAV